MANYGFEGRPKETLECLPDDWKEQVIELYKEGASDVEVRALLYKLKGKFSINLWVRWMKELPEFIEVIEEGRMHCQIWWEKQGRTNLTSQTFQTGLWYANMKNRFGWSDKTENKNEHSGSIEIKVDTKDQKDILENL